VAQYTNLTRYEIETILAELSINNMISFEVLSGGLENTNYLVNTENGKYVLSILETKVKRKKQE